MEIRYFSILWIISKKYYYNDGVEFFSLIVQYKIRMWIYIENYFVILFQSVIDIYNDYCLYYSNSTIVMKVQPNVLVEV